MSADDLLAAALARGATLHHAGHRHRSVQARLRHGGGHHVKRADDAAGAALLAREAAALRHLHAAARGLAPTLVLHEPGALVTRLVREAVPFPRRPAWRGLGAALARLHATDWPQAPALRPLALAVPLPAAATYRALSPGQERLLALAQGDAPLVAALDALARAWREDAPIHGDVKPDNALTRAGGRVVLTDLETAGLGPAAWDAGCALAAPLVAWVAAMPFAPGLALRESARHAAPRLAAARRAAAAFTRGYGPLPAGTAAHVGARLVQAAFEDAARSHAPGPRAVALLQLGASVLASPAAVTRDLLGVDA